VLELPTARTLKVAQYIASIKLKMAGSPLLQADPRFKDIDWDDSGRGRGRARHTEVLEEDKEDEEDEDGSPSELSGAHIAARFRAIKSLTPPSKQVPQSLLIPPHSLLPLSLFRRRIHPPHLPLVVHVHVQHTRVLLPPLLLVPCPLLHELEFRSLSTTYIY
jgi:hypothetical protein